MGKITFTRVFLAITRVLVIFTRVLSTFTRVIVTISREAKEGDDVLALYGKIVELANYVKSESGVATLDTPFADPDAEALRNKLNELLSALRRV